MRTILAVAALALVTGCAATPRPYPFTRNPSLGFLAYPPIKYIPQFRDTLPSYERGSYCFEFIYDMRKCCSWKHRFREAHMLRLVSPLTAPAVMLAQFPKRRHIKGFENSVGGHSAHVFLKYTPTGGYAKNPISCAPVAAATGGVRTWQSRCSSTAAGQLRQQTIIRSCVKR
jgi:hypothetical protein